MKTIKKIITHPGNAHRDELYSSAIALAKFGFVSIYRREPTQEELEDPEILVLDVGMRHEPERMNFDHHQFLRDAQPDCALSLFLRHLDIEGWFDLQPWYRLLVTTDAKGPIIAAQELGLKEIPAALYSPIDGVLLEVFGLKEYFQGNFFIEKGGITLSECDPFIMELRTVGLRLLENARKFYNEYHSAKAEIEVIPLKGLSGFLQRDQIFPPIVRLIRERKYGNNIAFSISLSEREGEGWVLYRYDDHQRIDFNYCFGDYRLKFIHKNGFIAKTNPEVSIEEAIELMEAAIK